MRANVVEYFAPAAFDDLLEIFVRPRRFGTTSATWECHAYRLADDLLMVTAQQTLVLVDISTRRPTPIPASYRAPIGDFEGSDLEVAATT
jgi:acyl-CoA thioester hydrolase